MIFKQADQGFDLPVYLYPEKEKANDAGTKKSVCVFGHQ